MCHIRSTFLFDDAGTDVDDVEIFMREKDTNCIWPDVQKVPHHSTAVTQRAMYIKQLESAGVSIWSTSSPEYDLAQHLFIEIFVFTGVFTSDQGSDQKAGIAMIQEDVREYLRPMPMSHCAMVRGAPYTFDGQVAPRALCDSRAR